jgi:two-component system LytT family response regulator
MLCICVDEIEWVAAAGNYIEIHTGRKTHLVRHTVKAMEAKLNPDKFLRVRPSAIVNVAEVDTLEGRAGGDYWVKLRNGTQIPSSRSYRDRIEEIFGKPPRRRRRRSDA